MDDLDSHDQMKESTIQESPNQEIDGIDFAALMKQGFGTLMPTIRASNSLPKGQQWDLFCTSPMFKPIMDSLGNKALELMALILHHQGLYRDIRKRDLEEKYELVVEANDKMLEKVGIHLDELSGIRRNPSNSTVDITVSPMNIASGSWNRDVANSAVWKEVKLAKKMQTPVVLRNARVTQRPQVKFLDKIDNTSTPFEPRIKEKPNALKPLAILYEDTPNEDGCYSHPYEFELDRFQEKIDKLNLTVKHPQPPRPVEETPLIMVTTEDQLLDMAQDLTTQTEIAVDLEHHSYRSFQGFTCLMQISTRLKDYIIDTLELRHKLHVLNEVFTNPKIVKVFHGADSDIQWLQRDLCLYVVNMFDTYHAALLLSLPRLSLAFLLKSYCNVDANKHFQLYDWRTRPLAREAVKYAREDTHYLLYIFDVMWNKLIEKSNGGTQLLQSVIFRSADTCKKRYWKFIFKEESYEAMYRQSRKNFDNRQIFALKELYAWRDKTAREEDESTGYVLPNHMLLLIAEKLPKEMQGILACCNPIPPLVRQNLVLLHQVILRAREQPLVARINPGTISETHLRTAPQTNLNLEGPLHCPHDLTHNVDFRDDLPTMLSHSQVDEICNVDLLEKKPVLPIFEDEVESDHLLKMNFPNQIHFLSPYERYKKMLLYIETEEKKSEEEKEREIAHDTQKLLDKCMRERQLNSTVNTKDLINIPTDLQIKEENQGYNRNPRKRDRSHELSQSEDINIGADVRAEIKCEEAHTPKKNKQLELSCNTPQEVNALKGNEPNIEDEHPQKKKKKNNKTANEVMPMNVGAKQKILSDKKSSGGTPINKKDSSENFAQYDYSQVDYSQYQQSEVAQGPKHHQDKFKHKGKKKQQNRSFTFARQFQSGNSKKQS